MPLTLEERERLAYIEGRTKEAALIGQALDQINVATSGAVKELSRDVSQLRAGLLTAEARLDQLRAPRLP